jgi:hypothetical protein
MSELGSSNGHHRFEDLCRKFAQVRLAPNILPATGPVGVGGDQGRDFETFRTYMSEELGPYGGFAARLKEGAVAFICTTQQDELVGKLRGDVAKIVASGTTVSTIYALLSSPLPVAKRHQIQAEVREKHGTELEILDGLALAEALADREVFWIAEEYLSIPADFRPEASEDEDELPHWYRDRRERWRRRGVVDASPGELSAVTDGLRHATFAPDARVDLTFWLDLVRPLALSPDGECPPEIRQRARYEVAVAEIRGGGSLRPADEIARAFLQQAVDEEDPAVLEDAAGLLSYAGTAVSIGHSALSLEELADANEALRSRIAELLDGDPPPTRRARLLQTLGHLALIPDPRLLETADADTEAEAVPDAATMINRAGAEGVPDAVIAEMPSIDIDATMAAWSELASLLGETPLFPVESWSKQLEFLAPLLVSQPGWAEIEDAVDAAIERLHGGDAAASRARDRAVRLQEAGRLRDALGEFHKAKMRWWTGDSLRGALLCMLAIAQVYKSLELPLAAKQYALAVAGAAQSSGDEDVVDLMPKAVMIASEIDYAAGAWVSALELADIGLFGHAVLVDADENPWAERDLSGALLTIGMALRAARGFRPELVELVEGVASHHGFLDDLNKIEAENEEWDEETWTRIVDEQLLGRPFSDLGPERVIRFAALGTRWTIRAPNSYRESHAAERLAAAAQLLLVELANDDICLLGTEIDVTVGLVGEGDGHDPVLEIDEDGRRCWNVSLSTVDPGASAPAAQELLHETLAALSSILLDISLLPAKEYFAAIERAFERGLGHKLAIGRPYDEMAEVVPESHYNGEARQLEPPFAVGAPGPGEHPELRRPGCPGPNYDRAVAEEMLANRYRRLPELIPQTMQRLRADEAFSDLLVELRGRGWLDWHVLTALVNLSMNLRLAEGGLNTKAAFSEAGSQARVQEIAAKPEGPEDPAISSSDLTVATLDTARSYGIPALVRNWDLVVRGPQRGFAAYEQLLAERYGYWSDDIPHDDPFASG